MGKKTYSHIPAKSDALFKSIMETDIATYEFLDAYLPSNVKDKVDLKKAKIERESYVEETLKKRLSDIVYSVPYKASLLGKQKKIIVYTLIEHQSSPDKWIAFRLWKYIMLLCERHQAKGKKLPLIIPFVLYNGKTKYSAPKNLWALFDEPMLAKEAISGEYNLIDLQAMSDEEIVAQKHLGMMHFFMKHIHESDMIKLWGEFFSHFKDMVLYDRKRGYIYIKKLIWYTDAKLDEKDVENLSKVIKEHLPLNEGEKIMTTIAEKYIQQGIEEGKLEGKLEGKQEAIINVALKMLKRKIDINLIASVSGLTKEAILQLKPKK